MPKSHVDRPLRPVMRAVMKASTSPREDKWRMKKKRAETLRKANQWWLATPITAHQPLSSLPPIWPNHRPPHPPLSTLGVRRPAVRKAKRLVVCSWLRSTPPHPTLPCPLLSRLPVIFFTKYAFDAGHALCIIDIEFLVLNEDSAQAKAIYE